VSHKHWKIIAFPLKVVACLCSLQRQGRCLGHNAPRPELPTRSQENSFSPPPNTVWKQHSALVIFNEGFPSRSTENNSSQSHIVYTPDAPRSVAEPAASPRSRRVGWWRPTPASPHAALRDRGQRLLRGAAVASRGLLTGLVRLLQKARHELGVQCCGEAAGSEFTFHLESYLQNRSDLQ